MNESAKLHKQSASLSDSYRELNAELHRRNPNYGTTGRRYVETVRTLARQYDVRHILDYGCGKRDLWAAMHADLDVRNFDPAIPGCDALPEPADLVACIDVLEHVEPEYLNDVLHELSRLMIKVGFLTIATGPSLKTLADGTNCHRLIENPSWWLDQVKKHVHVANWSALSGDNGLQVVIEPMACT